MTKSVLESGMLKDMDGHYELTGSLGSFIIPATLQDSLMGRLDRLVTAKAVAQYAAVIGRQFSYALLQAVSQLDEPTLQRELGRLVEVELVHQRGVAPNATYIFKHALVQDTAYESLLRSTRQGYHRRIAEVLEDRFPATAETQPELLAHHYTQAGLNEQAVGYWQKAGQKARQRSANAEAIAHLTKGLELLKALPSSSALNHQELALQLTLALAFLASEGQASDNVERTYLRARELCELIDDGRQLFQVLVGLWRCYGGRGQPQKAREYIDELFSLAQRLEDPMSLLEAHMARGVFIVHEGEFEVAQNHLEQAIKLYDPKDHHIYVSHSSNDPGVNSHSRLSWTLWFLGYPGQALDECQKSLALARQLGHVISLGLAYNTAAILYQLCGEYEAVHAQVEIAMMIATEHDLSQWKAIAAILQGWYLACLERSGEGLSQMQRELTAYCTTGTELYQEWFLALVAEAHGKHGQPAVGLQILAEALALIHRNVGYPCWEPELHRLKGELLLQQSPDNTNEAESCFHQAIAIAQSQSAKSWELRAATSLAKLWQRQGKREDAHELLAPVYNWFTEGFDTADLIDAKALLDELLEGR